MIRSLNTDGNYKMDLSSRNKERGDGSHWHCLLVILALILLCFFLFCQIISPLHFPFTLNTRISYFYCAALAVLVAGIITTWLAIVRGSTARASRVAQDFGQLCGLLGLLVLCTIAIVVGRSHLNNVESLKAANQYHRRLSPEASYLSL